MTALKFRTPAQRRSPFNNFVNDFFEGEFYNTDKNQTAKPSANVQELEDSFRIELLVPGFSKENFTVEVNEDILEITAKLEEEKSENKLLRNEFVIKNIERKFKLTEDIDASQISADYQNGILVLNLKKKEIKKGDKHRVISVK